LKRAERPSTTSK